MGLFVLKRLLSAIPTLLVVTTVCSAVALSLSTPVSEAPFREDSAQGAADVVQTYYALLGQRAQELDAAGEALPQRDGGFASGFFITVGDENIGFGLGE